ncbi:VWFA and cache domain-containing protein 1 [Arctopsyche grandis]|uniref:VWFA and cache domain-containing protein 1 n=1 Tax=Arctopsyche grandis TaxID=121162 RepID=UPI00406D983D
MAGRSRWMVVGVLAVVVHSGLFVNPDSADSLGEHDATTPLRPLGTPPTLAIAVAGAAAALSRQVRQLAADELGVAALQDLVAAARPAPPTLTDDDLLLTSTEKLTAKLNAAIKLLTNMKKLVMNDSFVRSFTHPCPLNAMKKTSIEKNDKLVFKLSKNKLKTVTQRMSPDKLVEDTSNFKVKRQYFMAASDGATDKDCRLLSDDLRLRQLFHSVFQPTSKQIVIMLDNGKHTHKNELRIAVSITMEIISMLQKNDAVALITNSAIEDEPLLLFNNCTRDSNTGSASDENKELLLKYVNNLEVSNEAFNVSHTFKAIDMISPDNSNAMIIYIGKNFDWIDDFKNASDTAARDGLPVLLNTCDISDDVDYSKRDISLSECDESRSETQLCKGIHIHFNSSLTVGQVSSLFMLTLTKGNDADEVLTTAPIWDPIHRDILIPLVLPCALRGLVVLDLYLADLAQDIIYFNPLTQKRRAFLINLSGDVIMHSSYSRPEVIVSKPRLVDISLLESDVQFAEVKQQILTNSSGKVTTYDVSKETTYIWKWVKRLYIICIVSEVDTKNLNSTNITKRIASRTVRELQYHRIDLLPPVNSALCHHFKQVSTIDKGTLYLSPSSFQSPFRYLFDIKNGKEAALKLLLQSCMAYLKDSTRLLSNPGLKSEIRNDVGLLYPMLNYYKRQHIHGTYNKYIVRRYASTDHGVLAMFPGSILESDYEPNRKAWFTKALVNPGRIIFTPPYLDVGGAGYIVTISYAPKDPITHAKPVLVVSMDITMGFLHKMLADSLLLCSTSNIKCFIMDEQGYLLSHPSLFDRKGTGPIEQQHITHKESHIANDMLNHKGFVQKKLCKNYVDGTLQRYYNFNNSITHVLTNVIHGEHCARYHITAIQGTNTFLGMVNSSCDIGAFCPCSVVDRLCLNCNRMEQNECECPCECVLSDSSCGSPAPLAPICEMEPERNNHKNNFFYNLANLKPCFDFQCDSYRAESSCLGVLGCEWCHLDADGESPLGSPFCSAQSACFGGILGAVTPYGEGSMGHVIQDDLLATYSAVGPIAGCIVAVCLILAIAVYCYKQNLSSSVADPYLGATPETWPDPGVQMSHLASEDDIHDERSGHQDKLIANDIVVPISPYRVVTGYRRPNTTGESDHGYSTMTPHDDSEHLAFASMEPFMSRDVSIVGDAASSPATSVKIGETTILPCGKNSVIAPVTVHRHMEAT